MNLKSILEKVKLDLDNLVCPIHGEHARITIAGKMDSPVMSFGGCCDDFKNKIQAEAEELLKKKTEEAIVKEFNDIIRKF